MFLVLGAALCTPLFTPEGRALNFLAAEVPRWRPEHGCYSCHHHGDAARALYTAARLGVRAPGRELADVNRWLARPGDWNHNGGDGPFNDRKLARLQFSAALVEALDAGQVTDRKALELAAAGVAADQDRDGSWTVEGGLALGSPATHGTTLATALARRTLVRADPDRYAAAVRRVGAWLRAQDPRSVLDAAGVLLGLRDDDDPAARRQRQACLEVIRKGQGRDGGWGPYVTAPPEVFDTAVVVLALAGQPADEAIRDMIRRGREFLVREQQPDGRWVETTRPAGGDSYAQRLSTAGWATLALLATRPGR